MGNRFLKKIKNFPVHPCLIILLVYLLICNGLECLLVFILVTFFHEIGHTIVAKKLGYHIDNIFITPYGASLNYKESTFDGQDELLIALAGPLCNIILGTIISAIWWVYPTFYNISNMFVKQSFLFSFFNLLPCFPLDGGRIFLNLFSQSIERKKIIKILMIFNIIFTSLFFLLFILSCFKDFNPTFALAGIFMILGLLDGNTQAKYKLISSYSKKTKNFAKIKILYVNERTTLLKMIKKIDNNKFIIFAVDYENKIIFIDEKKVLAFALIFPTTHSINEILKKVRNK